MWSSTDKLAVEVTSVQWVLSLQPTETLPFLGDSRAKCTSHCRAAGHSQHWSSPYLMPDHEAHPGTEVLYESHSRQPWFLIPPNFGAIPSCICRPNSLPQVHDLSRVILAQWTEPPPYRSLPPWATLRPIKTLTSWSAGHICHWQSQDLIQDHSALS